MGYNLLTSEFGIICKKIVGGKMKNKSNFSKIITFLMIFTLILSPLSGVLAQEDNAETVVNEESI